MFNCERTGYYVTQHWKRKSVPWAKVTENRSQKQKSATTAKSGKAHATDACETKMLDGGWTRFPNIATKLARFAEDGVRSMTERAIPLRAK